MKTKSLFIRAFIPAVVLTGTLLTLTPKLSAAPGDEAKMKEAKAAGFDETDKKLIAAAAESDENEISSSKMALEKATDPAVKSFAETMIKQHTESTAKLKPIAMAAGLSDPSIEIAHKAKDMELDVLSGETFDKAYIKAAVKAHMAILETMKADKDSLKNPELKKFVMEVTPVVEHHLMMAQELEKAGK